MPAHYHSEAPPTSTSSYLSATTPSDTQPKVALYHYHLPNELWLEVCEYLSRSSLWPLCLTSTAFLAIARPFLYRQVKLDISGEETTNAKGAFDALALLGRNEELMHAVRKLDVRVLGTKLEQDFGINANTTTNMKNGANAMVPGLTVAFFRNLVNLGELHMKGPILVASEEVRDEVRRSVKGLGLRRLTMDLDGGGESFHEIPHFIGLQLRRRNFFAGPTISAPVLAFTNACSVDQASGHVPLLSDVHLVQFVPPSLQALTLRAFDADFLPCLLATFNQLDALQELTVTFKPREPTQPPVDIQLFCSPASPGSTLSRLTKETLPHLKILALPVSFVLALARTGMQSLASLERLVLQRDISGGGSLPFIEVVDQIEVLLHTQRQEPEGDSESPMPSLVDLTIDFWAVNPACMARIMRRAAGLWGTSVRVLTVPFSTFNMSGKLSGNYSSGEWVAGWQEVVDAVAAFESVGEVVLRRWVKPVRDADEGLVMFVARLAGRMGRRGARLERVVIRECGDEEGVIGSWERGRDW